MQSCSREKGLYVKSTIYYVQKLIMPACATGHTQCHGYRAWHNLFKSFCLALISNYSSIFLTFLTCRAVAEEQRSLALGVQSVLWRALGSIPGPILFGVIFDSSCVYWQFDCGRRGNCWVYNNNQISVRSYFITTTGVLINIVFMFLCWIFYPPVTCAKKKTIDKDDAVPNGSISSNPVFNPEEGVSGQLAQEKNPTDLY